MHLYMKEALPAGSTVIAISNPQHHSIFQELPTVSKLVQTCKTRTLSLQLLIKETVHISWEKLHLTFKFPVYFLEHLLYVNVLYVYLFVPCFFRARSFFTSDASTSARSKIFSFSMCLRLCLLYCWFSLDSIVLC